jgi:hypothetical protein
MRVDIHPDGFMSEGEALAKQDELDLAGHESWAIRQVQVPLTSPFIMSPSG